MSNLNPLAHKELDLINWVDTDINIDLNPLAHKELDMPIYLGNKLLDI